jgi:hypothetical protein
MADRRACADIIEQLPPSLGLNQVSPNDGGPLRYASAQLLSACLVSRVGGVGDSFVPFGVICPCCAESVMSTPGEFFESKLMSGQLIRPFRDYRECSIRTILSQRGMREH